MRMHVLGIAVIAAAGWLTGPLQAQDRGSLVLEESSYFFVGGKIDPAVEGSAPVGQIYVEYMIPRRLRHRTPIVMVPGGSQTGTNFTGTPDGREGWAQFFARRGYPVYVVDQVARGRSAHWSQFYGRVTAANIDRLTQRFVAPERFKLWPQAHLHTQWPGTGKPGDQAFDQFYFSQFPSIADFAKQQEINPPAIVALLDAGIRAPTGMWGHGFVQAQFAGQLIARRRLFPTDLRHALVVLLELRHKADYGLALVSQREASRAVREAERFVAAIAEQRGEPA